uniref:SFRICE_028968 n=1 Tax=Spodoptera frugiperda TaxID=7108 RepID=A0A2H1WUB4_SPOFR
MAHTSRNYEKRVTSTASKWPLLTKGLFSHGEGLSINHHACSMRVGDFKLKIRNYKPRIFYRLPHWPSGRKDGCRSRGLGFDSRVGHIVARSLELYTVYSNRLTPFYMGLTTQMRNS